MGNKIAVEERKIEGQSAIKPKFRNPSGMTEEQLTDPDYRLKQLMKGNGGHPAICSKCHHCR